MPSLAQAFITRSGRTLIVGVMLNIPTTVGAAIVEMTRVMFAQSGTWVTVTQTGLVPAVSVTYTIEVHRNMDINADEQAAVIAAINAAGYSAQTGTPPLTLT